MLGSCRVAVELIRGRGACQRKRPPVEAACPVVGQTNWASFMQTKYGCRAAWFREAASDHYRILEKKNPGRFCAPGTCPAAHSARTSAC